MRSVGTALWYATGFHDAAAVGPLRLPREDGAGGPNKVLTHLEVWAPNMYLAEAEPPPLAAFHSPTGHEDLLEPPPPPPRPKTTGGGGGVPPESDESQALSPPSHEPSPVVRQPRTPGRRAWLRYCRLR